LAVVAEDIEHFQEWFERSPTSVDNAMIRRGSATLRRLLVEDMAGQAWRQLGFRKSPTIIGPDLLAFYEHESIPVSLVASAVAAGVRFVGIDWAFIGANSVDHPETGVPGTAQEGFAISSGS